MRFWRRFPFLTRAGCAVLVLWCSFVGAIFTVTYAAKTSPNMLGCLVHKRNPNAKSNSAEVEDLSTGLKQTYSILMPRSAGTTIGQIELLYVTKPALLFKTRQPDGQEKIISINRQTGEMRDTLIDQFMEESIISSDEQFVALLEHNEYSIYSLPDLHKMTSGIPRQSRSLQWSLQGHQFAYFRSNSNQTLSLVVGEPNQSDRLVMPVSDEIAAEIRRFASVFWSPDSSAIIIPTKNSVYGLRLDLYDLQAGTSSILLSNVSARDEQGIETWRLQSPFLITLFDLNSFHTTTWLYDWNNRSLKSYDLTRYNSWWTQSSAYAVISHPAAYGNFSIAVFNYVTREEIPFMNTNKNPTTFSWLYLSRGVIAYQTGKLQWMKLDGKQRHELNRPGIIFGNIKQTGQWLSYTFSSESDPKTIFGAGVVNLETEQHYEYSFTKGENGIANISPSGDVLVITKTRADPPNLAEVDFMAVDGSWKHGVTLASNGWSGGSFSPNGSQYMIKSGDTYYIFNLRGDLLRHWVGPKEDIDLQKWTDCTIPS